MKNKGFTLIEVLVVVGMLAILMAIVIIAINPPRQFSLANNTKRRSDILAILNAVHQYAADNKGTLPSVITTTSTDMGTGSGEINICTYLVPNYLAEMPFDPKASGANYSSCTSYETKYQIKKDSTTSRITVAASSAELSETISITR
ncbi:MAG: prepilin-type N-terminal cleavage/methylation domain-containing protein [Parcubacteria group bacterium]|nr:prepilin-type N-terminal cleavage/methylation domain-containing protein [Parcubacteria group bacterium]